MIRVMAARTDPRRPEPDISTSPETLRLPDRLRPLILGASSPRHDRQDSPVKGREPASNARGGVVMHAGAECDQPAVGVDGTPPWCWCQAAASAGRRGPILSVRRCRSTGSPWGAARCGSLLARQARRSRGPTLAEGEAADPLGEQLRAGAAGKSLYVTFERRPGLPAVRRVRTRLCRQRRGQHGLKPQPAQSCPVALPAGRGELRRPPMTIAGTPRPARGRERIPIEEECHDRQPDG
jgi:hypothetical protein